MVGISYGMGVLIVNLVYLFISLIIGIIVGRVFKRWKVGIVTFLIVIILPFYDLIIQKGIKTYYENFVTLEEIYSYPERDENGKIESLSIEKFIGTQSIESLKNVQKLEYIKRYYHTLDFLDIYVYGSLEKIVDEENQRAVFYRINNLYKAYWKYPTLVLASDLESKNIGIVNFFYYNIFIETAINFIVTFLFLTTNWSPFNHTRKIHPV